MKTIIKEILKGLWFIFTTIMDIFILSVYLVIHISYLIITLPGKIILGIIGIPLAKLFQDIDNRYENTIRTKTQYILGIMESPLNYIFNIVIYILTLIIYLCV